VTVNISSEKLVTKIDDEWQINEKLCKEIGDKEYDVNLKNTKDDIPENQKAIFDKILKKCQENKITLFAKSKKTEKELNEIETPKKLKDDQKKTAEEKKFSRYMDYIAISTIVVIGLLMVLAITCPLPNCNTAGFENPFTRILESNFFMVLVATIVGPIVSKFLKEKYDIQIKSEQIAMITQDAIKAVSMYQKSAAQLRDDDGNLPQNYKEKLQDLALNSIYQNFGGERYSNLLSNVGGQVFKKAIEAAVAQKKIESFPLEQNQVEKIINQSIDAVPYIVEWQSKDEKVKEAFIRGYVKDLLQNTGAEGWAYKSLEGIFEAEVNKRITAAAIAETRGLIPANSDDPMKKYTTIITDAVLASGVKN